MESKTVYATETVWKTLNMSMLKYFFEAGSDIIPSDNVMPFNNGTLFDGLEISKEKELCEEYMGNFR